MLGPQASRRLELSEPNRALFDGFKGRKLRMPQNRDRQIAGVFFLGKQLAFVSGLKDMMSIWLSLPLALELVLPSTAAVASKAPNV